MNTEPERAGGDTTASQDHPTPDEAPPAVSAASLERRVWETLSACHDPEIPVNVVDLGLIYGCQIEELEPERFRVSVQMTLTAPGCSMGELLRNEIAEKLLSLPSVVRAQVDVVLDPPWDPSRMSEAARLEAGLF